MSLENFLSTLNPTIAKQIKTAAQTETIRLPLASIGLTHALGGGIGVGRCTLIYGNTSSGKSLVVMESIAEWQKQGLVCAYADAEGTYDKQFAARLGIDNESLILIQKRSFGAITDAVMPLIKNGLDVLVVDSISDALPEVFIDERGDVQSFDNMKQIGAAAKSCTMMVNALHYSNTKTAIILISQTTTKITPQFVKQVPHGGEKINFASSQIIRLTSSATELQQIQGELVVGDKILQQPIGRKVKCLIEKNKLGPQSRTCEYDMYYDGPKIGIDKYGELVDLCEKYGLITKASAWFYFEENKWNGRPKLISAVKADSGLFNSMQSKLHTAMTGEFVE